MWWLNYCLLHRFDDLEAERFARMRCRRFAQAERRWSLLRFMFGGGTSTQEDCPTVTLRGHVVCRTHGHTNQDLATLVLLEFPGFGVKRLHQMGLSLELSHVTEHFVGPSKAEETVSDSFQGSEIF